GPPAAHPVAHAAADRVVPPRAGLDARAAPVDDRAPRAQLGCAPVRRGGGARTRPGQIRRRLRFRPGCAVVPEPAGEPRRLPQHRPASPRRGPPQVSWGAGIAGRAATLRRGPPARVPGPAGRDGPSARERPAYSARGVHPADLIGGVPVAGCHAIPRTSTILRGAEFRLAAHEHYELPYAIAPPYLPQIGLRGVAG